MMFSCVNPWPLKQMEGWKQKSGCLSRAFNLNCMLTGDRISSIEQAVQHISFLGRMPDSLIDDLISGTEMMVQSVSHKGMRR